MLRIENWMPVWSLHDPESTLTINHKFYYASKNQHCVWWNISNRSLHKTRTRTVAAVNPFFLTFAFKFIDKDKCESIKHLATEWKVCTFNLHIVNWYYLLCNKRSLTPVYYISFKIKLNRNKTCFVTLPSFSVIFPLGTDGKNPIKFSRDIHLTSRSMGGEVNKKLQWHTMELKWCYKPQPATVKCRAMFINDGRNILRNIVSCSLSLFSRMQQTDANCKSPWAKLFILQSTQFFSSFFYGKSLTLYIFYYSFRALDICAVFNFVKSYIS